jgi:hypothetical protein
MRRIASWVPLCLVSLAACSPPSAPPAPAPVAAAAPVLNLKQVMEWVIDPAADVIWDSVKSVSTEAGTKEIAPQNDEQWAAVRNAAATLIEARNLLMVSARARDDKGWAAAARDLEKTAGGALKAAEAKDKEALFAAGGEIYVVCKGCHVEYAKHLSSSLRSRGPELASARTYGSHASQ